MQVSTLPAIPRAPASTLTRRRQLPLPQPPQAQAEAAALTSSPCVLGHSVEGGATVEGRTPWPKTCYGQQSSNIQHPKSTPWYRSSELGHTQQLPPVTLRATAHTPQVSTKDLRGQMAHFLPCREWVWTVAIWRKACPCPRDLLTNRPGGAAYTRMSLPSWPGHSGLT